MMPAEFEKQVQAPVPARARRRLISFRLTEEEYAHLTRLSAEHGAPSLSDFVRSHVCAMLETRESWEEELTRAMREFGRQASGLHALVDQLAVLLRSAQRERRRAS
jgi:Arc/MetJ-type ribon-helix-helix transcriptional regulator